MAGCDACAALALALIGEPIWDSEVVYGLGDYVVYAGILYKSTILDNLDNIPGDEAGNGWDATTIVDELFALSQQGANPNLFPSWQPDLEYTKGYPVSYSDSFWVSKIGSNGSIPGEDGSWQGYPNLAEMMQALFLSLLP